MNETKDNTTGSPIFIEDLPQRLVVHIKDDIKNYNVDSSIFDVDYILSRNKKDVFFINDGLKLWDSSCLSIIFQLIKIAQKYNVKYSIKNLPKNMQDLILLAFSIDRNPTKDTLSKPDFLERLGIRTIEIINTTQSILLFCKNVFYSFLRLLINKSIMRFSDFISALNECGPKAIGIVSLISFLVGLILAFVGAIQLQQFGAQIYVASLVTIGMCRIMGAIMVGIIMAGRTGSSYAASIGTMQVNEELDALQTMGLSRIDFLVMPRLLALIIAMPILTMLSDFLGIMGGGFVGIFMLDLPYQEYARYTINSFYLNNFLIGLFHSICFGIIIALAGCFQGLNCGRNSDSVGIATTKSVVYAIVWMIIATGIITIFCMEFKI